MIMKKIAVLVLAIIILVSISPAAFAAGKITNLEVQVWPEYDDPGVLIMHAGRTQGLKSLTMLYPKDVRFGQVLSIDPKGKKTPVDKKSKKTSKGTELSFNLPTDQFFCEGYWNILQGQSANKKFDLKVVLPVDVDYIELYIQQPATAKNFSVKPKPQSFTKGYQGLQHAKYVFNNKKKGDVLSLKVSYVKNDNKLSVQQKGSQPQSSGADTKTIVFVLLALVFFAGGIIAFYGYKQGGLSVKVKRSQSKSQGKALNIKINYCPNCGSKAKGKFCGQCGKKLG